MLGPPGLFVAALAALTLLAPACGDDGNGNGDTQARVAVSGSHGVQVGGTLELSASTEDGTDTSYAWASADDGVATVDSSGVVTAVAAGEVDISATGADTGATGYHAVVVSSPGTPVVNVEGDYTVLVGTQAQMTATTVDGSDSSYTWASSDEAIATVDASGNVNAINSGEVTITATGDDTGASGSIGIAVSYDVPNFDKWRASGHADKSAEAFNHWNEDGEVPTSCARCHSTPGYRDYLGDDGSAAFAVDQAAEIGTVIECQACHNDTARALSRVIFPSGEEISGLDAEARCMTCHQGRESTVSVDEAIATAGVDDDTTSADLGFKNIHYFPAGATLNGGRVSGGYEYASMNYEWRFRHVPDRDTCNSCHDPHSLEVEVDACAGCHDGVNAVEDAKDIRMIASVGDYDGDGDTSEGVYHEIDTLQAKLMTAIQSYTGEQGLSDICYHPSNYPYFFIDTSGNGTCEDSEAEYSNQYDSWTPRLVQATYNYQFAKKDTGAFAHNAKYVIQVLHDSIADLNGTLTTPVDMANAVRNDPGHFNGAGEPARHWDADGEVSASCSRCHSGEDGFGFYLEHGTTPVVEEPGSGLGCATCHADFGSTFNLVTVADVTFPSGITVDTGNNGSNLCSTCHQGRAAKATVDSAIADNDMGFVNVHYLPAGGTRLGADAQVGYEYDGQTYAGPWNSHPGGNDCASCHSPTNTSHTFQASDNLAFCQNCHGGATTVQDIRIGHTGDYDGDADTSETLAAEIDGMAEAVLAEMQAVATVNGTAICYDGHSYPYFFIDTNENGVCEETEAAYSNQYDAWTAPLMKAAFNFQYSRKDPGAWAHNFDYMAQLLYDSIADLGGDVSGLTRP